MNIIELWDNIKWSNIWIGVPKEKNKKEKGQEKKKKSEEVMAEKFPNSIKPINDKSKRFSDHKHKKHKKKQ